MDGLVPCPFLRPLPPNLASAGSTDCHLNVMALQSHCHTHTFWSFGPTFRHILYWNVYRYLHPKPSVLMFMGRFQKSPDWDATRALWRTGASWECTAVRMNHDESDSPETEWKNPNAKKCSIQTAQKKENTTQEHRNRAVVILGEGREQGLGAAGGPLIPAWARRVQFVKTEQAVYCSLFRQIFWNSSSKELETFFSFLVF